MATYGRGEVEELLRLYWDPTGAYGRTPENVPDADMPKGDTFNPAKANTLWAELADVGIALRAGREVLTDTERHSTYWVARGVRQDDIASAIGVTQKTVSVAYFLGVGKLVDIMNGEEPDEHDA